jgi:hypothetical protein
MKHPENLPKTFEGALSKLIEEMSHATRSALLQLYGERSIDPNGKGYHHINDLFNELYDVLHAIEECKRLYAEKNFK